jgi:hypothetical protein
MASPRYRLQRARLFLAAWWERYRGPIAFVATALALAGLYLLQSWFDHEERLGRLRGVIDEQARMIADLQVLEANHTVDCSGTPLFWIIEGRTPRQIFDKMTLAVHAMDAERGLRWAPYDPSEKEPRP